MHGYYIYTLARGRELLRLLVLLYLLGALAGGSLPSVSRQRGVTFKSFQAIKPYGRGDDSLYISSRSDDAGVFDGVGSWTDLGIDCSKYTKALSMEVVKGINEQRREERDSQDVDLARALEHGMERISADDINYSGSTTVCMASLNAETHVLSLLNIGDSGCMLFRKRRQGESAKGQRMSYELVMATNPMVVDYNAPFQIGNLSGDCRNTFSLYGEDSAVEPPSAIRASSVGEEPLTEEKQRERLRKLKELSGIDYRDSGAAGSTAPAAGQTAQPSEGGAGSLLRRDSAQVIARKKTLRDLVKRHERSNLFSSVREADSYDVVVRAGDVIILGTDGVWDNVFISEIVEILNTQLAGGTRASVTEGGAGAACGAGDDEEEKHEEEKHEEEEESAVQGVVDQLSKKVLGTVFNRKKASPFTLARLAYLRQKPSLESVLGSLFRRATGGGDGNDREGDGIEKGAGKAARTKGRDFAAPYELLDEMARTAEWTPQEEGQLRKEKVFGGKVDDVTIVVGVVTG